MVSFSTVLSAALLATTSVQGLAVPYKAPPAGWATTYLEPYMTYHIRYVALDCQDKHNTSFFDTCCHPLLVGEALSSRPSQCTPSASASSSASAADATSTASSEAGGDDGDDDCDDGDSGDDGDSDDGDDDDCTDDSDTSTTQSTTTSAPINVGSQPTLTTSSKIVESTSTHAPTSTHVSKVSTSVQASSTQESTSTKTSTSASSSSTSGFVSGGVATFFYQNGVAGACGTVHSDSALIAAIDQDRYADSGNESSLCGKQVEIINTDNGKSVTVTIADDCPTCTNGNSIDLSVGAFKQIATEAQGEVPIKWKFVS